MPDPALAAWFKSLRQPGSASPCCSIADCRFTVAHTRDGQFEVEVQGQRIIVPESRIVRGIAAPDGRAVVCYAYSEFRPPAPAGVVNAEPQDKLEVVCFVPPRPTS